MRDSKNVTAVCDLPDTQQQRDELLAQWEEAKPKVQRVAAEMVARAGGDAELLTETLKMLGIHPKQKDVLLLNTELGPGAALRDFNP
jgi:hypothetical protein